MGNLPKSKRLVIGPLNTAGQGYQWARAVEMHAGVRASCWSNKSDETDGKLLFRSDEKITGDARWFLRLAASSTHVIFESGRPFPGRGNLDHALLQALLLRAMGRHPALMFHGSDIRLPSAHVSAHAESLFSELPREFTSGLEQRARKMRRRLRRWPFPVFVSTPDLLAYAPGATWVPVIPDLRWFDPFPDIEPGRQRPRVLHLPSRRELAGSNATERVCRALHERGLIEFRSVSGVAPDEVFALVAWADIVIDKIGLSVYGVMSVQAMAAGRILIGDVDDVVRRAVPDLPLLSTTSAELERLLEGLLAERSGWAAMGEAGRLFTRKHHDGRRSAEALAGFLGVTGPA